MSEARLFVGLISGTSRDGVDAALVDFESDPPELRASLCLPYPGPLADALSALVADPRRPPDADMRALDEPLARHFADTALRLLETTGVDRRALRAVGSHGQTVWHAPQSTPPESIQLGSPALIATLTGLRTVGDFRRADIECGGQGAPLAPLLHRALLRPAEGRRVVLNLGGIANISLIDEAGGVSGFDTGPANCLLDGWIRRCRGEAFDRDGAWAATGAVLPDILDVLVGDPYFARPAPKSTGTEYFNLDWLERRLAAADPRPVDRAPADLQATLAELTAATVADAVRPLAPRDLLVCGGGVHNADLLERLRARLPGIPLRSTAEFGLDPDCVEAVLFAWLARERLAGRPQDTRAITGARHPILLGDVYSPPGL